MILDEEIETKSTRVSDLEWESEDMKEKLAQLHEDLLARVGDM